MHFHKTKMIFLLMNFLPVYLTLQNQLYNIDGAEWQFLLPLHGQVGIYLLTYRILLKILFTSHEILMCDVTNTNGKCPCHGFISR